MSVVERLEGRAGTCVVVLADESLLHGLSEIKGRLSDTTGGRTEVLVLDLTETERVARISVVPSEKPPTADRLPLAVAQVVFTAMSAEGVDRVQLLRSGRIIEVPLPGGARTSAPVGAGDYLELLTGSLADSVALTGGVSRPRPWCAAGGRPRRSSR